MIQALNNEMFIDTFVNILRMVRDEEILANACKCFRITMREDANLEFVVSQRKDIANIMIEALKNHEYSEAITQEVLSVSLS